MFQHHEKRRPTETSEVRERTAELAVRQLRELEMARTDERSSNFTSVPRKRHSILG